VETIDKQCSTVYDHYFDESFGYFLHLAFRYYREFNRLSRDLKMHVLLTVLLTFLMELVRRICLNIKTCYPC